MAIETYFEDIADAIRERGGTSATLTPAQMPQAILDIPGGGGGMAGHRVLTPLKFDVNTGLVHNNSWIPQPNLGRFSDVYAVDPSKKYMIHYGAVGGDRLRVATFVSDPTDSTSTVYGQDIFMDDNAGAFHMIRAYTMFSPRSNPYDTCLVITKTVKNVAGIISYVIEFDPNA